MKLTVLGSGGFIPTQKRGNTSFYLHACGQKILVDCGAGTLRQLIKAGIDFQNIDIIIISHMHLDHFSDFGVIIESLKLYPNFIRKKDLRIIAHPLLKEYFNELLRFMPGILANPPTYKLIFEKGEVINISGLIIRTTEGNHSPSSIITSIKDEYDKEIVYTGDTSFDITLGKFTQKPDLFITECNSPTEFIPEDNHLYPKTAGELATLVKAKKLLLYHLSRSVEKLDLQKEVKKYYSGKVIVAEDFLTVEI